MRKNIMFVDDDQDDIEIFSDALRNLDPGVEITVAENGLKALDMLNNKRPSLIVLDLNMPFLDGKQTFEKIKANPQLENVPIIIFTSSINPADRAMFDESGISFLSKPDTVAGVDCAVAVMLDHC
ncbi:MAG TPA: response regulator [Parafilimonas sp.]|nr:response regulator [Parafilimonas sp.]